jgi:hypothetical protein
MTGTATARIPGPVAIARHRDVQPPTSEQNSRARDFGRGQSFAPEHDPEKWESAPTNLVTCVSQ